MLLAPVAGEALLLISVPQKQSLQVKGSLSVGSQKDLVQKSAFFHLDVNYLDC